MKRSALVLIVWTFSTCIQAQFTKAMLQASGLTCSMCNNAVNKALQKVPFVASVKSDIKNAAFDIVFKENSEVNIDDLKNAVEDAGFSVAKLKLTGNFKNVKVANDENIIIGGRIFQFLDVKDQVLNGEQTIMLVDKDFLTAKEFNKFSSEIKMTGLRTGQDVKKQGAPVFHVTM